MIYFKEHLFSILCFLLLAFILISSLVGRRSTSLAGYDSTSFENPITLNSTLNAVGTTTISRSVDGLVVGGSIPVTATGTVRTVFTNTTGPKICDASTFYLYVKNNGSFSPALRYSLGTSTSAIASKNLVASSTVATSTSGYLASSADTLFFLNQGDVMTAIIDDLGNTLASSTYFSNLAAEAGVWCNNVTI